MTALFAIQTTQRSIGYVVLAIIIIGGIFFVLSQMRIGRREAGSEIELAPNRRPYYSDEELETKKLNMALWSALGLLIIVALSLPLYWLAEGGRQAGAVKAFHERFVEAGAKLFGSDPLEGAKCESCHGLKGVGAAATYVITDENGDYVDTVTWSAPALDTVMYRFSTAEVKYVLTYGRPGSPMQPWGVAGGGALSDQQLDNLLNYLWSIQLPVKEVHAQVMEGIANADADLAARLETVQEANAKALAADPSSYDCQVSDGTDTTETYESEKGFQCLGDHDQKLLGEILFRMKGVASGAYSCARCHTPGFSFGKEGETVQETGRGSFGPSLVGIERKLTIRQHFNLIMTGTEDGKLYGSNSVGSGKMPGFGLNANAADSKAPVALGASGMYTPEQVWAVVVYERNLSQIPTASSGTSASTTTTTTKAND